MSTALLSFPQLITGERMSREEFLARWDNIPGLKHAELIDGAVYVPSPVSWEHSRIDRRMITWLTNYADQVSGCVSGNNATWLMLESSPQPDSFLSRSAIPTNGKFYTGAPELVVEVCVTSTEIDFGPKLALYQRAGVQEYITIETLLPKITWRHLHNGSYEVLAPGPDQIYRSVTFPGLWLHVPALFADDGRQIAATLQSGLDAAPPNVK
jgi:Uma2 family endonuclease